MIEFLINWLAATPSYAAPLLLACLGLIINERAGVLNLGIEGMMPTDSGLETASH